MTSGHVASIVFKRPLFGHAAHFGRNAVRRVEQLGTFGHVGHVLDEHRPFGAEALDDVLVVNDLVIDVNRHAEQLDRQLERLDGHVHARTKAARTGENDFHVGRWCFVAWVRCRVDASGRGLP